MRKVDNPLGVLGQRCLFRLLAHKTSGLEWLEYEGCAYESASLMLDKDCCAIQKTCKNVLKLRDPQRTRSRSFALRTLQGAMSLIWRGPTTALSCGASTRQVKDSESGHPLRLVRSRAPLATNILTNIEAFGICPVEETSPSTSRWTE